MDRTHAPGATTDHKYTEGNPGAGIPATTVSAVALNAFQEELVGIIEAAGIAPSEADNGQVLAALEALFGASSALALQQLQVHDFSSLTDLIPTATKTNPSAVISQFRATSHRKADGTVAYVDLDFSWCCAFADSSSSGWRIPAVTGALGAAVDAFLRTLWGIGSTAEWAFPFLSGTVWQGGTSYSFSIYHQPVGPRYSITGVGFVIADPEPFGRISLRVPVS